MNETTGKEILPTINLQQDVFRYNKGNPNCFSGKKKCIDLFESSHRGSLQSIQSTVEED